MRARPSHEGKVRARRRGAYCARGDGEAVLGRREEKRRSRVHVTRAIPRVLLRRPEERSRELAVNGADGLKTTFSLCLYQQRREFTSSNPVRSSPLVMVKTNRVEERRGAQRHRYEKTILENELTVSSAMQSMKNSCKLEVFKEIFCKKVCRRGIDPTTSG